MNLLGKILFIASSSLLSSAHIVKRQIDVEDGGDIPTDETITTTSSSPAVTPAPTTQNSNDVFGGGLNFPNFFTNNEFPSFSNNGRNGNNGRSPFGNNGGGFGPIGTNGRSPFGNNGGFPQFGFNGGFGAFGNNGGFPDTGNSGGFPQNGSGAGTVPANINSPFQQNFTSPRANRRNNFFDPFSNNGNDNFLNFPSTGGGNRPFNNFFLNTPTSGGTNNNPFFTQNIPFANNPFSNTPFPKNPFPNRPSNYPNTPVFPKNTTNTIASASPPVCNAPDSSPFGDKVSNAPIPGEIQSRITEDLEYNENLTVYRQLIQEDRATGGALIPTVDPTDSCPGIFQKATSFSRYQGDCWIVQELQDEIYYSSCKCQLCLPPPGVPQVPGSLCKPFIVPILVFAYCENTLDPADRPRIRREKIGLPAACVCRNSAPSAAQPSSGSGGSGGATPVPTDDGVTA